jgi:transposase-like protein
MQCPPQTGWNSRAPGVNLTAMKKSDVTCPECHAGYRRIELQSKPGTLGEFRCLTCDHLLEIFDGSANVALRLTVQPAKKTRNSPHRVPGAG